MDLASAPKAIDDLLTAIEYATPKEDRAFSDKPLNEFGLPRLAKPKLIKRIQTSPGLEPFFLAVAHAARPRGRP